MSTRQYLCKGPVITVADALATLSQRCEALEDRIHALPEDHPGALPLIEKLDALGAEFEALADQPAETVLTRGGCGYDLTAQINAIPDDGDVYHYTCESCGNRGTVRKLAMTETA